MGRETLPVRLQALLVKGETETVEFRKALSSGVYESIAALANAEGGYVFAGLKRDGTVLGLDKKQRKDFAKNLRERVRPELSLFLEEYETDGKVLGVIRVPSSPQVVRCSGCIFLRHGLEDRDITDDQEAVFRLYTKKTTGSYVNRVTRAGLGSLRPDLIARIKPDGLTDEEYLLEEGLFRKDVYTQETGVTLAALLLFGTDEAISQALPMYRTELTVNSERAMLSTNLIESYEQLTASDPDNPVLQAVCSNLLIHRDYSSSQVARLSILDRTITSENPSVPKGYESVFIKNPPLSRVFRSLGLASEAGTGMKTIKKCASVSVTDGSVFRVSLQLGEAAAGDDSRVRLSEARLSSLLEYLSEPRTRQEIQDFLGIRTVEYVRKRIVKPMLVNGLIVRTIPDKPNSRNQKYIRA